MRLLAIRGAVFCLAVTPGWLPLAAQSSSYHTQLSNDTNGRSRIILVNDSDKPIEAYHASQRCQAGGVYSSEDVLDHPGVTSGSIHGPDGERAPRSGFVERGGRWDTFMSITTNPSNNSAEKCDTRIEAVLFADGSYEGKEAVARGLKARRDGIRASVSYWENKFNSEDPDGSSLAVLHAEAKRIVSENRVKLNKYQFNLLKDDSPSLLHQYWAGRLQVDTNVAGHFPSDASEEKQSGSFHYLANYIHTWKTKIDNDVAMKRLDTVFPPFSEPARISERAPDKP
jgi:hypothetical protein